ncbi:DegV family protein with EDD domain [Entomoplasma freundtii]|uniref:Fatty acid-binding protein DegV n=1 Tax=Entomoplasma freundtii TaxID=74700 RepID=A0A2K8NUK0_9MOLU|nr:DegV family protein [Entomoplasma freundtii]ATZ16441.1 fatty acid-binding protein DegV [Entomoplasma freundtii]TDY55971.1 DegV family protein with EDD domain [Entomoplasma freundtii]
MRIAILTDSSWGGNPHDYRDLYVVPLMMTDENGQEILDNKLSKNEFYKLLDEQKLKTALTPPGIMLAMWDKLLIDYDQVIFAGISKGLSSQFNTYRVVSETEDKYKGKVFVVDTNGVSVVLEHEIEKIVLWTAKNKNGFEVMELMAKENQDFCAFIIPKSLETLKRGGRITPTAAAMAKVLKIVPILRYDGTIDKEGTARTFKRAINEALSLIRKNCKNVTHIDLAYSESPEVVINLVRDLIAKEGFKINLYRHLPYVIAAHTGRETFALVAWKNKGDK